ncbi:MAG: ABC transporter permease [Anaerolineaceae bacterium]|nr:ABC transporter permease [Anaerolineaceae bacterium]
MIRNIFQVFLYELQRNIRRKGYIFTTFLIPALLFAGILFFNLIATEDNNSESVVDPNDIVSQFEEINIAGVVDLANIIDQVPESLAERMLKLPDVETARSALESGTIDIFYVIQPNYLETGEVVLHMPGLQLNLLNDQPIELLIEKTLAGNLDSQLLRRIRNAASFQEFNLQRDAETDTEAREDADFLMVYVFTIAFLMSLFMTNGYLMSSVIEEKENRLIEILMSTLRPFELLSGKILAMGVLGLLQMVIWFVSMFIALQIALALPAFEAIPVLLNLQIRWHILPILILYFIVGYLFFAALYSAVGAISGSMREGPQYAVIFTLPAVLPFYFFALVLESPNGPLPVFFSMFPITAPIGMLMRLSITDVPAIEIIISLALLTLAALGAMWMAGRLFRVQVLLTGQTPKIGEIIRLIVSGERSNGQPKTA